MTVRRATPADLERLADLNAEVQDLHVANMPDLFKPMAREDLAAYFEQMLADDAAGVLVACEGQEVVGYVLVIFRERPETPVTLAQRWLYIEQIGVAEAHRRRGHATALVETARAMAKGQGLARVELDTWGFNEQAQAFFRSVGFHTRSLKMAMEA